MAPVWAKEADDRQPSRLHHRIDGVRRGAIAGATGLLFRLIQGMRGPRSVPLPQATMLDIYPFSRRRSGDGDLLDVEAMGPVMGPTMGGYLTEMFNWRYVFYVNLPFGILSMIGLALFMPKTHPQDNLRFAGYGFAAGFGCVCCKLALTEARTGLSHPAEILIEGGSRGHRILFVPVHMSTSGSDAVFVAGLFHD